MSGIIVGGNELRDEANFELDADARTLVIAMHPALAIEPIKVTLSWALLKKTMAQVMIFEADVAATGKTTPEQANYLRVKRQVAQAMLREAEAELTAAKGEKPAPSTPGFDAAGG